MTTEAQRQANRLNARRSTGPRTAEGKAASARNAIRHNLSGTTFVLLPNEDRDAFDALLRAYEAEWEPRTPHETFLVAQMVQARWRLDRIARMEAEVYDAIFTMPFAQGQSDEGAVVASYPLMNENMLDKLHRYAKDAERSYHRAVRELRQYRKSQPRPAEVVETKKQAAAAAPVRNEPDRPDAAEFVSVSERHAGYLNDFRPENLAELEGLAAACIR